MNAEGHTVACLTGEFQGAQRDIIIDSFRSGSSKVLITTNVLSRGIDVQTVSLVVNYVSLLRPCPQNTRVWLQDRQLLKVQCISTSNSA